MDDWTIYKADHTHIESGTGSHSLLLACIAYIDAVVWMLLTVQMQKRRWSWTSHSRAKDTGPVKQKGIYTDLRTSLRSVPNSVPWSS